MRYAPMTFSRRASAAPRMLSAAALMSWALTSCVAVDPQLAPQNCSAWEGAVRRLFVFRNVRLADDTYQIRLSARSRDEWALMGRWRPIEVPAAQRHLLFRAAQLARANNRSFLEILPPGPIRVTAGESSYVLFKDEIRPSDDYYMWTHYHLNIRFLSDEAAKKSGSAVNVDAALREGPPQTGRCS